MLCFSSQAGSQYGVGHPAVRKEVVFPPDSVEAVLPVGTKRRRLHSKDVSPLEAWRLMMCLKSGLLAESTWALDVLSVLLYDDSTVLYFGLSHLPGLLETLMEHYRRCLALVFGIADDLEMGYDAKVKTLSCSLLGWLGLQGLLVKKCQFSTMHILQFITHI